MSSLGAPAGAVKHPEMHGPGLHASVIETVSAWFEGGAVARSVVIGELALAHNAPAAGGGGAPASPRPAHVRLDHFPVLEKVAPNPIFVQPLPGRAGEYTVDVGAITRPQVAFKYQVHLDGPGARAAHAPVILAPTWKAEAAQISVILNYSPNPAFASSSSVDTARALQNVVVAISIEGAKAAACQSKPVGVFSKERGTIHWRLGDLSLEGPPAGAASQRLLARFTTDGPARPGAVEARWEMGGGAGSGLGVSVAADEGEAEGREDPFADARGGEKEEGWREVGVQRKLVSGKYIAN